MKILLDESFPRPLLWALRAEGLSVEQIITLSLESLSAGGEASGLLDRLAAEGPGTMAGPAQDFEIRETRRLLQEALYGLPE